MNSRFERIGIEAGAIFIVISAVAGGIGPIGGGLALPSKWLAGTPFTNYSVPGAILGIIVGGSALLAAVLMLQQRPLAVAAALGAGVVQVGWIIGERLPVGTRDQVRAWLQAIYLAAGAVVAILAVHMWLQSRHTAPDRQLEFGRKPT
jgi:hypothetical protein